MIEGCPRDEGANARRGVRHRCGDDDAERGRRGENEGGGYLTAAGGEHAVVVLGEAAAALVAVAQEGVFDDGGGGGGGLEAVDLNAFAFERFVVLEEAAYGGDAVAREFAGVEVAVVLGVVHRNGEDFVVRFAGVDHRHQADRAGVDER